jgi:hypothetical protein
MDKPDGCAELARSALVTPQIAAIVCLVAGTVIAMQCPGQDAPKPLVTDPIYTKAQRLVDVDHG